MGAGAGVKMLRLPPSSVKNAWTHESFCRNRDNAETIVEWPSDEHCSSDYEAEALAVKFHSLPLKWKLTVLLNYL